MDREAKAIRLRCGHDQEDEARVLPYSQPPELLTVIDTAWKLHERLQTMGVLSPCVFPREDGGSWKDSFYDACHAATVAAGCPGKPPHDFRRTAARTSCGARPEKVAIRVTRHKTRARAGECGNQSERGDGGERGVRRVIPYDWGHVPGAEGYCGGKIDHENELPVQDSPVASGVTVKEPVPMPSRKAVVGLKVPAAKANPSSTAPSSPKVARIPPEGTVSSSGM